MNEGSVKYRLQWLEEVAVDKRMRGLPLACAVLLATRYVNSESGLAWPSVDRLARELQTDRRNCRRALDQLVDTGWLGRSIGGGRGRSNRYYLKAGAGAIVSRSPNGGLHDQNGGAVDCAIDPKWGVQAPRTLEVINPGENAGVPPQRPSVDFLGIAPGNHRLRGGTGWRRRRFLRSGGPWVMCLTRLS